MLDIDLAKRREKGQFWTPEWVAVLMARYALTPGAHLNILDPAVGDGAMLRAVRKVAGEIGAAFRFVGVDIDPTILPQSDNRSDDVQFIISDFFVCQFSTRFDAIISNPPYIRHHRIPPEAKALLRKLGAQILGKPIDGRAGLHVYFLIRALSLLARDGRLAFIIPADVCEGRFARELWEWVAARFAIDAVVTFSDRATPFPDADVNPIIVCVRHVQPQAKLIWAQYQTVPSSPPAQWLDRTGDDESVTIIRRDLREALATGFTRHPMCTLRSESYKLGDFATVVRGIATGANDFFLFTQERARRLGIPERYLVRIIGRTRDIVGDEVTAERLQELDEKGRPTWLLSIDEEDELPESLRNYLREGEHMGLPARPLLSTRRPWYRQESRRPPPFLFAYLGRRNVRFIRNTAQAIPLTTFLCIYPKASGPEELEKLWCVLNHPQVKSNLSMVAKSYGRGAIKVEPRALEQLPIPPHLVEQFECATCGSSYADIKKGEDHPRDAGGGT